MNTRLIAGLLVVAAAAGWQALREPGSSTTTPAGSSAEPALRAFAERQSDVWMTIGGTVDRLLPDDTKGSRHQRFILRVAPQQTVLVAHNIDLAPRIDSLRTGDALVLRGEYEWNDRGGVLHWTHHDPDGRPGGWIDHAGRRYE